MLVVSIEMHFTIDQLRLHPDKHQTMCAHTLLHDDLPLWQRVIKVPCPPPLMVQSGTGERCFLRVSAFVYCTEMQTSAQPQLVASMGAS